MNCKKIITFIVSGMLLLSVFGGRVYAVGNVYEVQKGDCLWKIAERFLGDGARYTDIVAWNKELIQDPNLIYPGMELKINADAETGADEGTDIMSEEGNGGNEDEIDHASAGVSGNSYVPGTVGGTSWESEWLGMRFELPEGFEFKDVEEFFDEIDDVDIDDYSFDDLGEYTDWEFVVVNPAYLTYAFLAVEQSEYSVEDYVREIRKMNDILGMDISRSEEGTVRLGRQSFERYFFTAEYMSFSFCQDYYATKKDGKIVMFVFMYFSDMENKAGNNLSEYWGAMPQSEIEALIDGFSDY